MEMNVMLVLVSYWAMLVFAVVMVLLYRKIRKELNALHLKYHQLSVDEIELKLVQGDIADIKKLLSPALKTKTKNK